VPLPDAEQRAPRERQQAESERRAAREAEYRRDMHMLDRRVDVSRLRKMSVTGASCRGEASPEGHAHELHLVEVARKYREKSAEERTRGLCEGLTCDMISHTMQ
jgi:hypothetical protein